jgi:hypothetical protein
MLGDLIFRPYIGSAPIFRNDREFLPLQAADMYAWQIRRYFYENKVLYQPPRAVLKALQSISSIDKHLDATELADYRRGIQRLHDEALAQNPELQVFGYQGTQREQRAAGVAARKKRRATTA